MDKPISYKGSEPYIFVSYAHKDADTVWPIIARMQADGYRVCDGSTILDYEWDADTSIASLIEGCSYFIAFLSEDYLASIYCMEELNFALYQDKEQLPVYLSDVTLPAGMRMRLSRLQAIHWYTYENEDKVFSKLYEAKGLDTCQGNPVMTAEPTTESADAEATVAKSRTDLAMEMSKRSIK